jgi:hypothetical protein
MSTPARTELTAALLRAIRWIDYAAGGDAERDNPTAIVKEGLTLLYREGADLSDTQFDIDNRGAMPRGTRSTWCVVNGHLVHDRPSTRDPDTGARTGETPNIVAACYELPFMPREDVAAMVAALPALVLAARATVSETTPAERAETIDGAANLTARDWIARAVATLRENDTDDCPLPDMIGDVLDDLTRALKRMEPAHAALAPFGGITA